MGKKSFALGRGLAAIMKDHDINFKGEQANTINNPAETSEKFEKIVEISIDLIDPNPYQPRKAFDDEGLSELADSIKQQGLIQPIALRKVGDRYQIISGERRTRATKIAGLPTIKAQVFEDLDDKAMAEWALIENIQRVDLNPVEIARSYQQLIDKHGYKHEDLAKIVSKSRSAITNSLRLLKLPEQVLLWIEEGKLNSGAARALCSDKIGDPESLAERIIEEGLNVRQIEAIIRGDDNNDDEEEEPSLRQAQGPENSETPAKPKPELSADMKQFETRLETFFGTKVQLNPSSSGKPEGTIVIKYYSMDDLTRIQEIMENR
ncbi:chromosome partitioning protein, ParB family [Fibrobacter sp. UWT3]|uniref:ParB/RepB/Spo0J family partition protein n=1 Tax=Fibrobacter sp. UWT3 TaxID=1896225 RepID=UPI000BCA1B23|nr:ParB/RepB/Spo0J family partition protein [Fibrobacter sp. UWT3]SOE75896.1 chromosome partitioning protein, ParB family [Fibrobacter sp. UWT3]